jgi:hypothetical protein
MMPMGEFSGMRHLSERPRREQSPIRDVNALLSSYESCIIFNRW